MKATMLLRIASLLTLFQYGAHAYLFLSAVSSPAPTFGYGLMAILSGFVAAVLLWLLAALSRSGAKLVLPFVALLTVANLLHALLAWRYFGLLAPVIFDLLIAVILTLTFVIEYRNPARVRESFSARQ
ncbi:MAG: hypothetical protein OJF55_001527 [Rhodanobacteraceae bacterium]|jgi:hypothetical protein|nr:MAG: hypothetical protein OJF55_001527 [Rhodanobacteraceae bacterium]